MLLLCLSLWALFMLGTVQKNLFCCFFYIISKSLQIVVPSTSKLKDVLEEVKDLLPDDLETYTLHDTNTRQPVSLSSPTVGFVGTELKVVKLHPLLPFEEQRKYYIEECNV